jgi:hypothetical protein
MRVIVATRLLALVAVFGGCDQSAFDPPGIGEDTPPGPGSPTWDDTDLSCASDSDCAPGESCSEQQCRPRQCDEGPYSSTVPLGPNRVLFREQELFIVDATQSQSAYWVDSYQGNGSIGYAGGSFSLGAAAVVDVARIHTADGGGVVAAVSGQTRVKLAGTGFATKQVDTGLVPVAVAAGDVDGDATDEIVVLSAAGGIAICKQAGGCKHYNFGNGERGVDVAVADTNADGVAEIMFLLRTGDATSIAAWSVDVANGFVAASFDTHFDAITAGDIDVDGRAEIAVLEDRGWFGFASDRVHFYRVGASFTGIVAVTTTGSAIDLAAGDLDGGEQGDAVVVLGDNQSVDVLRWTGSSVAKAFSGSVATTSAPRRIAVGDFDNDSVAARLVGGPTLVAGSLVPTMVVTFPPYHSTYSDAARSGVAVGNRNEMTEAFTDTIALNAGIEVGVGADFLGLFNARIGTRLGVDISRSRTLSKTVGIGTKFSLRPQPELYGNQYAAVVVACNCFHVYEYEMLDAANRLGVAGKRMKMIVPVGGQTTVLSTPRYNALAATVSGLPAIAVPTRIGDVASYPRMPTKLDGTPVQPDEHVFAQRPTLRVSDVGAVGFSMSVATSDTNTTALMTTVSVSGSLGGLGVSVGSSLGVSWGKSYAIVIGSSADFGGEVPPLPNKPDTPEDEYLTHAYSFSPYLYRQPYTNSVSGEATGYYVLDYTVGPR